MQKFGIKERMSRAKIVIFANPPTRGRSYPGKYAQSSPTLLIATPFSGPDASNHPKVVYRIRVVGQNLIGRHGYSPPVGVPLDEHISSGRIA
ncbi:hypothetical protein [Oceaniovalibus sp. ACAM 378]|uniref:hypothetical protein n=1 Tax=Oceaniovalibus sp. ACAM 378 TaxID=2599923 RepID=UPI0011D3DE57|nr:hypothetical protein [Oceaniovalibus sp. ACAM 378]TYB86725.1 hypothetical protein FQ320_15910 [Oceaniovalibus sp. ACAM 378]